MFKTPVYHDPYDSNFVEWALATLVGTWKVKLDVESFIEFSHEEDAIAYEITWYQVHAYSTGREAGAFYCPYVPLTSSGVIMDSESVDSVTTFITRYSLLS
jgi:hypothetical protein